jgi:hypothetical protein
MVQHSDIDSVTSDLKASLIQSAQAAFQQQTQSNETLITPLPCSLMSTPDHPVETESTQVQVRVSETCTGMVYNTQAMQNRLKQITTQKVTKQLGDSYSLLGTASDTITLVTPKGNGSIALQVHIESTWSYHFTDQQQQQLISRIVGKSRSVAMNLLLHTPGVQSVSVSSATLPTDAQHIHLIVVYAG